jgi:transposase
LIVDAQSVKNTDTAGLKGYDAGKKVSGIKRHIAVDSQGLPHAVAVTTAEVTDRTGALQALGRCKAELGGVQSVLCDGGYAGKPFAQGVREVLGPKILDHYTLLTSWQRLVLLSMLPRTASLGLRKQCAGAIN